jgi:hypothetical protein
MEKVATLPAKDRAELFRETATRRGLSNAIAEKDFWVCWSIAKLFDDRYMKLMQTCASKPAVHFPLPRCWLNPWNATDTEPSSPWA